VSVQDRSTVCAKRIIGSKLFWTHPMVLLGDEAYVEAGSARLGIVLILTQDTCTVCDKCNIGSEIVFDAPDGTPR
jgi:hypothetical protein